MSGYLESYLSPLETQMELIFFEPFGDEHTVMKDLTSQLSELVLALAGRSVLLLAHSFGSAVVLEMLSSASAPFELCGLMLMAWIHNSDFAGFWLRDDHSREARAQKAMLQMSLVSTTVAYQARDTMVALGEFFFAETHMEIGVSMLKRASWNGLLSNPKGSLARHLQGSFCFHNLLRSLRVPVLSLAGELDQRIPPRYYEPVVQLLPDGSAHRQIDGAGHFPFVEKPDEVVELLRLFAMQCTSS